MKVPFVDLSLLHPHIKDEISEAINRVMESGRYILGPEVEAFEKEFAAYVGTRNCVSVASGTEALILSLRAVGVKRGDEVVVPANTCSPTWLAAANLGALPVPVDPDPITFTLDPARLMSALSPRTRAIVPVHLYGHPVEMDPVLHVARRYGIPVVEDAAQAHGARYRSARAGSLADAAAWSFYPTKNLGALGDGGAVTTDDDRIADHIRSLRNYGWHDGDPYVSHEAGMNSRLDELQAAVLRVKLRYLDTWNSRRTDIANTYGTNISNKSIVLPTVAPWATHAWHLYVVRCLERDLLREYLASRGITSLVHYPLSPQRQPAFNDKSYSISTSMVAMMLENQVLSIPIGPNLADAQVQHVIDTMNEFNIPTEAI